RTAPLAKIERSCARWTSSTRSPAPARTRVCSPTTPPPRRVITPISPSLRGPTWPLRPCTTASAGPSPRAFAARAAGRTAGPAAQGHRPDLVVSARDDLAAAPGHHGLGRIEPASLRHPLGEPHGGPARGVHFVAVVHLDDLRVEARAEQAGGHLGQVEEHAHP